MGDTTEVKLLKSLIKHLQTVQKELPYLNSGVYSPRACNAWQMARKEIKKLENKIK